VSGLCLFGLVCVLATLPASVVPLGDDVGSRAWVAALAPTESTVTTATATPTAIDGETSTATTNGISGLLVGVAVAAILLWRRWRRSS
jgi:hypothetical protein